MSASTATGRSFKTRPRHRRMGALLGEPRRRPPGDRRDPIVIRLAPQPGATPSRRPPVRIFIGTEPAQFRAERALVWSIVRQRDPARSYHIHLMSELTGFDRATWKTGFTHYRYAVPELAGYRGRAIYNDVDQVYLADPAELFDQEMHGAAVLSIDDRETSVMLLDCARLRRLWPGHQARAGRRHKHFRARVHEAGLWGHMDACWNARDDEYQPGRSKLLHFTTLHTQPWRPFPRQLRYRRHPLAPVWEALEQEADAARFTLFTADRPSRRYVELLSLYQQLHDEGRPDTGHTPASTFSGVSLAAHVEPIARLIGEHGAATVLDYGAGKGSLYRTAPGQPQDSPYRRMPAWGDVRITCYDPAYPPFASPPGPRYDGVITTDVLEHIPAEDIGWVLHHLFDTAERFVYAVAACFPAKKILPDGSNAHCTLRPPDWWAGQMALAARAHPTVAWTLCTEERSLLALEQRSKWRKPGIRQRFYHGRGDRIGP